MVAKTETEAEARLAASDAPPGLGPEETSLYGKIPLDLQYVHHESFDSPSQHTMLAGQDPPSRFVPRQANAEGERVGPRQRAKLTTQEEARLFLQYNYARYRVAKLQARAPGRNPAAHAREMTRWYGRALEVRAALVEANLALVYAMAKRFGAQGVDFADLVSEGNFALLRAIESFDPSRGLKFSTYACRAILNSCCRLVTRDGRRRHRFPLTADSEFEESPTVEAQRKSEASPAVEALSEVLSRNRAGLTSLEQTVVLERFGIAACGKRKTLLDLGHMLGLCAERVRQIQRRALGKLRVALENECVV